MGYRCLELEERLRWDLWVVYLVFKALRKAKAMRLDEIT